MNPEVHFMTKKTASDSICNKRAAIFCIIMKNDVDMYTLNPSLNLIFRVQKFGQKVILVLII